MSQTPENNDFKDSYLTSMNKVRQQLIEINGKLINHQEAFNNLTNEDLKQIKIDTLMLLAVKLNRINNALR